MTPNAETQHLVVPLGGVAIVELPSLGTAGYRWRHDTEGDTSVVAISWKRGNLPPEGNRAGVSSSEIAVIKGMRMGHVVVRFSQARPWETDVDAREVRKFAVRVRKPNAAADAS